MGNSRIRHPHRVLQQFDLEATPELPAPAALKASIRTGSSQVGIAPFVGCHAVQAYET
jgi:hypothetical protein